MHAPRPYALARPPETLRVAVLGSSVVYGLATGFADTIPAVVERELQAAGHRAEVLNFGTHAFTIVNLSAPAAGLRPPVPAGRGGGGGGPPGRHSPTGPPSTRARRRPTKGSRGSAGGEALLKRGSEKERPARPLRRSPAGRGGGSGATTGLPLRPRPARRRTLQPEARSPLPAARRAHRRRQPDRELAGGRPRLRGEARARALRAAGRDGGLLPPRSRSPSTS